MSEIHPSGADPFARLDNRTIVITGASGGIGSATAEIVVRAGASVVLAHGPGDDDERAAKRLASRLGTEKAYPAPVDVVDEDSVAALLNAAVGRFGSVSGLVTAAGVMEQASLADLDPSTWQRTIDVNLTGTYNCVRAAYPLLRKAGGNASIVTVSSQLAYSGARDVVAYSASKAGILGLTRALAHELGPQIRINAVAPGPIDTPMTSIHSTPEWVERKTSKMIMHRFGSADEVASVIRFLLSDEASFLTGQSISPNGGGVML